MVIKLNKSILYLGYDWLVRANLKIDWMMLLIARVILDEVLDEMPNYLTEFTDVFSDMRVKRLLPHQGVGPLHRTYLRQSTERESLPHELKRN